MFRKRIRQIEYLQNFPILRMIYNVSSLSLSIHSFQPMNEYAPDVAAAREQANQQLRFAENTRRELLKKLHRVSWMFLSKYYHAQPAYW